MAINIQQAIELHLKGLLNREQHLEIKTHKLTTLAKHLESSYSKLKSLLGELSLIQDFYFDKRCPGDDYYETTEEECKEALETMYKVLSVGVNK